MLRIAMWVEVMACQAEKLGPPGDTTGPSVGGLRPCSFREYSLLVFTTPHHLCPPHKTFDLGASHLVLASPPLAWLYTLSTHSPLGQQDAQLDSCVTLLSPFEPSLLDLCSCWHHVPHSSLVFKFLTSSPPSLCCFYLNTYAFRLFVFAP